MGVSQGSVFINNQIARALPALVAQGIRILHSVGGLNSLPEKSDSYQPVAYIEDIGTGIFSSGCIASSQRSSNVCRIRWL
ncbi:MAG: hypothetical protein WDO06_10090 [Actinomycetota bacterium]